MFNIECILRDTIQPKKSAKKSIFYIERKLLDLVASWVSFYRFFVGILSKHSNK